MRWIHMTVVLGTFGTKIFWDRSRDFVVLCMSLIILISTVGAANHLSLPVCDICNPFGGSRYADMQSRGKRFAERVRKTECCRQWAGFAWLCGLFVVCEFSFCLVSWAKHRSLGKTGPGLYVNEQLSPRLLTSTISHIQTRILFRDSYS